MQELIPVLAKPADRQTNENAKRQLRMHLAKTVLTHAGLLELRLD